MKTLLFVLGFTQFFYLLFMVFAAYHSARRAGREIHWLTYVFIGPPVLAGYAIDVAWNTVLGTLFFLEPPWKESWNVFRWTFTGRLIRNKGHHDWRGRQARFWAKLLNPFDPGHV